MVLACPLTSSGELHYAVKSAISKSIRIIDPCRLLESDGHETDFAFTTQEIMLHSHRERSGKDGVLGAVLTGVIRPHQTALMF